MLLRAGCPRIGVHHPLGGVLPGGPPSIQLETDKEGRVRKWSETSSAGLVLQLSEKLSKPSMMLPLME